MMASELQTPGEFNEEVGIGLEPRDYGDGLCIFGVSRSTAYEHWAYARARLRCLLEGE